MCVVPCVACVFALGFLLLLCFVVDVEEDGTVVLSEGKVPFNTALFVTSLPTVSSPEGLVLSSFISAETFPSFLTIDLVSSTRLHPEKSVIIESKSAMADISLAYFFIWKNPFFFTLMCII